ncbi:MAG: hypothetical protein GF383_10490 [Candidatus Lokiarchaeota archaeon]|nr:hypothetical protein [Candidatus Lokiarchaeota archaeon]MBD3341000.1 hypothetical protein [Candidatus Lokiarchaeota archaeon]
MKIVIFEPHPDDLLMGPGHVIFDWLEENHEIHIITITDGRACFRKNPLLSKEISEEEVAEMRLDEARKAIEFLGISLDNLYLLEFPDSKAQKYVDDGIQKVKPIILDADRLVFPSDNNLHEDHQATHNIAIGAARELELKSCQYWIYLVPQYGRFNKDSELKQITVELSEERRKKMQEWLQIYQSQKLDRGVWKLYTRYLKYTKKMIYGIFDYEDMGKYYNF